MNRDDGGKQICGASSKYKKPFQPGATEDQR
jgi:hypothetical protein